MTGGQRGKVHRRQACPDDRLGLWLDVGVTRIVFDESLGVEEEIPFQVSQTRSTGGYLKPDLVGQGVTSSQLLRWTSILDEFGGSRRAYQGSFAVARPRRPHGLRVELTTRRQQLQVPVPAAPIIGSSPWHPELAGRVWSAPRPPCRGTLTHAREADLGLSCSPRCPGVTPIYSQESVGFGVLGRRAGAEDWWPESTVEGLLSGCRASGTGSDPPARVPRLHHPVPPRGMLPTGWCSCSSTWGREEGC